MNILPIKNEAFKIEQATTDECLIELRKYGKPRLGMWGSSRGWHACIDVFVTGKGVEFEVKSEFTHSTPKEALNVCYNRLMEAVQKIKETK